MNRLATRKVHKPISTAVAKALELYGKVGGEVVVAISDSAELHELNRTYRSIDSTTDVLTFPGPDRFSPVLGDVILNWEMAEIQAAKRGVPVVAEAAMLAVHGALHLMGFDDHSEGDRAKMLQAMNEVMRAAMLPEEPEWHSLPHGEGANV